MEPIEPETKKCCHRKSHLINGYKKIYYPEHHLARENGFVYEHIIIAEKMLGRELKKGETVHHIDHNRGNNLENNLMVFITNADHSRYHKTGVAIKLYDGTYYSPEEINRCVICGKPISYKAKKCKACYLSTQKSNIPQKEELISALNGNSMEKVGKMYNVTGKTVKKWRIKYNI